MFICSLEFFIDTLFGREFFKKERKEKSREAVSLDLVCVDEQKAGRVVVVYRCHYIGDGPLIAMIINSCNRKGRSFPIVI